MFFLSPTLGVSTSPFWRKYHSLATSARTLAKKRAPLLPALAFCPPRARRPRLALPGRRRSKQPGPGR
eukprot:10196213-Alexandrium_andersonii.AAC.1